MPRFDQVGKAILLLREKQNKSQKELALQAGITSAMLSNYETGVKKPSLDSLGKILDALGLYMGKMDDALDVVNDRPMRGHQLREAQDSNGPAGVELTSFLGATDNLPPDLERGFTEMVAGFQRIARHVYRNVTERSSPPPTGRN